MWERNLEQLLPGEGAQTDCKRDTAFDGIVVDNISMKRSQTEEDIVNTCLFLVFDLLKNITGQSLLVNGGQTMS